jgi:hypothetical protein
MDPMKLLRAVFLIVPASAIIPSLILTVTVTIASASGSSQSARITHNASRTVIGSLAQVSASSDDDEVPPADVEKYIAVYQAMQRDHTLTAEQAASRNGMTLEAFRQLEDRVQRDDAAMEHVRDELKAYAAGASPGASPTGANPAD